MYSHEYMFLDRQFFTESTVHEWVKWHSCFFSNFTGGSWTCLDLWSAYTLIAYIWWFLPGQVSRTCLWCDLRVMWTSIRSYCVWHKRIFHVKMGPAGETTSAGGCWGHIMSPWIDAPDVPSAHISSRHRSASSRAIKPRRGTDSIILLFKFVAYLFIFSIESEDFSNILHLHRPSSQTHVLGTRTFRKSCLHCRRGL